MRHIKLLVASVLLVSVSACTADKQSALEMEGYIKTINVIGPDDILFEQTKATSVSNGSALVFNWAAGDTLGIFPNKGNQVEFPITTQQSSTSATFDGGGWALRNNASYAAYYPFSVWNYFQDNKTIIMDYSGQVQNGNGSFAHLSAYDYLASAKTTPRNNVVTFQMDRQGSILYIDIVVPEPATINSLTVSCDEAIFVEKAALNISGNNPVITPKETKQSLTLAFANVTTTVQNETVRAYMAVQPLDFSSKTVTATLATDAGTYTAPVVPRVVNKGKAAFLRFSGSFTDGTPGAVSLPALSAVSVSNIQTSAASLVGAIVSNGNSEITECGFCWSAVEEVPTVVDNKINCDPQSMELSTNITSLIGGTRYYVRSFAKNAVGYAYSAVVTFETLPAAVSEADVWDGTIASMFDGGSGVQSDPIKISTGAQLAFLAQKVNAGTTYDGVYFVLTANIDLNDKQWTPIGGSSNSFWGHFNGQGHSISGLKINRTTNYVGLFGYISGAAISNMHISGKVTGVNYVGMLFGYGTGTVNINNVATSGQVEGTGGYVGGIGGDQKSGKLINSSNSATVTAATGTAGGLIGGYYAASNYSGSFGSIINCVNYGNVKGGSRSGGIRGTAGGGSIRNCCNYSDVQPEIAIQSESYSTWTIINCFWLNDIANDYGCESGWKSSSYLTVTNSGYFARNASQCFIMQQNNKDVVEELNKWVNDNAADNEYLSWHYETVGGFARPALEQRVL